MHTLHALKSMRRICLGLLSLLLTSCEHQHIHVHQQTKFTASTNASFLAAASPSQCFFVPPEGWLINDPTKLTGHVQISFIKPQEGFCPSINLAIEPTDISQEEYVQTVQSIHENHHADRYRRLGKIYAPAGTADLTELDMTTEWGPIRLLQLILVKEGSAYIVTAAASKKEIANYYADFQASFRSLQLTSDLISVIPDITRRTRLAALENTLFSAWETLKESSHEAAIDPEFQKTYWTPFEETIMKDYTDMGAHWQLLFLKSIYSKLQPSNLKNEDNSP